jgi:sigma-B regulation protein RsbQ
MQSWSDRYGMLRIVADTRSTSLSRDEIVARNNVTVLGPLGAPVLVFVHGFGCDQGMYQRILPFFVETYRIVLFDHALDLRNVTLVAHSVGAMMALAAAVRRPDLFDRLVLLAPSPSYLDDADTGYVGGLSTDDVQDLLESLDDNHMAWASTMAPVVMGNTDVPELAGELEESFCRVDPQVMRTFARVTFLSDVRDLLPRVAVPSLILQCSNDALAPLSVGDYLSTHLAQSELVVLSATGHVPQVSAPRETAGEILRYIASAP